APRRRRLEAEHQRAEARRELLRRAQRDTPVAGEDDARGSRGGEVVWPPAPVLPAVPELAVVNGLCDIDRLGRACAGGGSGRRRDRRRGRRRGRRWGAW